VTGLKSFLPTKRGEFVTMALMTVNVFVLLMVYYVLKVVREPLILLGGGAELKSYASAGQAILLIGIVPAFSALAARRNRIQLLTVVQLFFTGCLVAFYFLARAEAPIGLAFYLWLGIFSAMVVSNFWSFATDLYTEEQGKRLFGIIGVGGSAGALVGAIVSREISGTYELMLLAAIGLLVSLFLYWVVDRRDIHEHPEHRTKVRPAHADEHIGKAGGFKLVFQDRYLRYVALFVVVGTVVNTTGEYIIGTLATEAGKHTSDPGAYIKDFYASYYGVVNVASLAIQGLVVTRVIGLAGIRRALFIMPLFVLGSWTTFLAFATFAVVRVTKTTENSLDYSLNNTVKQALYLPTTREEKYKAKAAIDTFFFRGADVLSAGIVFVVAHELSLGVNAFAITCILLTLLWLAIAWRTGKLHDGRVAKKLGEQV